ncbi:MAG: universal stress protein [Candidatus Methanomethylicia archaeon]|uniref:Universal stress protein n=1 Tax=Candidatus Methanomethylicus mesodigestus TaxID=1867258 RepID=A0A7C3J213_9CREN|nr:universal stress protein [Candidatus Methanomethylicia archaeon]
MFKNILVPLDGSPASLRALDMAIEFSMKDGSKLTLIYVVAPPPFCNVKEFIEEMSKVGRSVLDMACAKCECAGLTSRKLLKIAESNRTSTANEIVREAIDGHYDCVILGSRGYSGEMGILMGSVAVSAAISLPCTTIIVR